MRFRIPFEYSASVVEKKKRNPENKDFWEWLDVEIAEADDAEAPVALRWHDEVPQELPSYSARDRWGAVPNDGECVTRWFEGRHWMPALARQQDERTGAYERLSAASLEKMCAAGEDYANPAMLHFPKSHAISRSPEGNPLVESEFRLSTGSTREREIAQIQAKTASLLIVDGIVWERSAEPVLYLKEWIDLGHSMQLVIKVLPCDASEIKDPRWVYRVDRFDEAAEAAILEHGAGEVDSVNAARRVHVLLPESVSYADEEMALCHSARRLLEKFADKPLKEFTQPFATAWFGLRDAFVEDRLPSDDRMAALETAFENFSGLLAPESDMARETKRALDRWQSRPISFDAETEPGPVLR